jgi:hypothetical protein
LIRAAAAKRPQRGQKTTVAVKVGIAQILPFMVLITPAPVGPNANGNTRDQSAAIHHQPSKILNVQVSNR